MKYVWVKENAIVWKMEVEFGRLRIVRRGKIARYWTINFESPERLYYVQRIKGVDSEKAKAVAITGYRLFLDDELKKIREATNL